MRKTILAGTTAILLCAPLWGQQANPADLAAQNAALEQHVKDLEERLIALEGKVRTIQSAQAAPPPAAAENPSTVASAPAQAAPVTAEPQAAPSAQTSPVQGQAEVANSGGALPNYG